VPTSTSPRPNQLHHPLFILRVQRPENPRLAKSLVLRSRSAVRGEMGARAEGRSVFVLGGFHEDMETAVHIVSSVRSSIDHESRSPSSAFFPIFLFVVWSPEARSVYPELAELVESGSKGKARWEGENGQADSRRRERSHFALSPPFLYTETHLVLT